MWRTIVFIGLSGIAVPGTGFVRASEAPPHGSQPSVTEPGEEPKNERPESKRRKSPGAAILHVDVPDNATVWIAGRRTHARSYGRYRHYRIPIRPEAPQGYETVTVKVEANAEPPAKDNDVKCTDKKDPPCKTVYLRDRDEETIIFRDEDFAPKATAAPEALTFVFAGGGAAPSAETPLTETTKLTSTFAFVANQDLRCLLDFKSGMDSPVVLFNLRGEVKAESIAVAHAYTQDASTLKPKWQWTASWIVKDEAGKEIPELKATSRVKLTLLKSEEPSAKSVQIGLGETDFGKELKQTMARLVRTNKAKTIVLDLEILMGAEMMVNGQPKLIGDVFSTMKPLEIPIEQVR